MRNINQWTDENTTVQAEIEPTRSEYGRFWPMVSLSRVQGSKYQPYKTGSADWRKAANALLAQHARSNFEQGRH